LLEFTVDESFLNANTTLLFAADDGLDFIEKYIAFEFVKERLEIEDEILAEEKSNYTVPV
jgi:hypothetical protein